MSATKTSELVNDKWIFLFIYPSVAILMVHVGNDNSFGELLKIPATIRIFCLPLYALTHSAGITGGFSKD